MNDQMKLDETPYEIKKRILERLDEEDLKKIYQVSKSWQLMIVEYLNDKHSIKATDWKWFCRDQPQIEHC